MGQCVLRVVVEMVELVAWEVCAACGRGNGGTRSMGTEMVVHWSREGGAGICQRAVQRPRDVLCGATAMWSTSCAAMFQLGFCLPSSSSGAVSSFLPPEQFFLQVVFPSSGAVGRERESGCGIASHLFTEDFLLTPILST